MEPSPIEGTVPADEVSLTHGTPRLDGHTVVLAATPGTVVPATVLTPRLPFVTLVTASLLVSLLLYVERPAIRRHTVVAFVPWMVVGAALSAFSGLVPYPDVLSPLVVDWGAYLTTYVLVGLAWFAMLQASPRSGSEADPSAYVASMGVGAASVLLAVVFLNAGTIPAPRLAWLLIAPIVAVLVAPAVLVVIGLWYIDAPAYLGVAGGLVVFAQVLDGLSTVIGVGLFDADHTLLSAGLLDLTTVLLASTPLGVDPLVFWTGGFLWVKVIIATLAVIVLTPVTRARPGFGYALVALLTALGVTAGASDLLAVALGGVT